MTGEPAPDGVTGSDRRRAAEQLARHAVGGRLTTEDAAARADAAAAAQTAAELAKATEGLPALPERPVLVRIVDRVPLRAHVAVYACTCAVLVFVWVVTRDGEMGRSDEGFGLLWPFWIMLVWGSVLATHALYALRGPAFRRRRG